MIGKLTGIIDKIYSENILLDLSGVGYLVYTTTKTKEKLVEKNNVSLLIETHVREDAIQLFGFLEEKEKKIFNLLNQVSGVGAKLALSILSQVSPDDVIMAINLRDKEQFKKVSGVGPKLAERMILELKDKIGKITEFVIDNSYNNMNSENNISKSEIFHDAIAALVSLGISKQDASNRINKILKEESDIKLDNLIRKALK